MSEAYVGDESPEGEEHEDAPEEHEGEEGEGEGEGEEGGEDGEEDADAAKRLARAEKQAHDKAGLAAKERSKRRAAERQNAELLSRIERLETQTTQAGPDELNEIIAAMRDDDDEPITDINLLKKAFKKLLARQAEDQKIEGQRTQVVQTIRKISTSMDAFERDFAEDHPDYFAAATHYRDARVSELEDLGYTGDRLMQKLAQEFFNMTEEVMQSGRDPAEVVYGLAKKRGFASGKAAATAKLQKLQKAGDAGASPRGKGQDNGLTWDRVARAKGSEKDRLFKKLRAQELGKS